MVGAQRGQAFNVVAPVAVQLARYAEPGHQLRTGLAHAVMGGIAGHGVEGTGGVGHHEHIKLFFQGRQGREGNTHFRHDAGDDQLLLAGGLHCLDEVFVVPGVDLAWAGDVRGVREQGFQLWYQRAVGALLEAGGEDGRQVEELGQVSQGQHVVLERVRLDVADQGQQASLVVDQQDSGVVFVQAVVFEVGHGRCS
ncbi:hypothetical protein D3C76_1289230 [compost metagenome]